MLLMKEPDTDSKFILAPEGKAFSTEAKINVAGDMRTYRIVAPTGLICN